MMSVEEEIGGVDSEKKFWGTPELLEQLLFFLDLESIKQLAASHKLTRKILGKTFVWNQLIKRIFPKDHNIEPEDSDFPQHHEDLASDKAKVKILTEILNLSEGSDRTELAVDLLHTICERHPILDSSNRRQIDVGCSCNQTHTVSVLGFLLLTEIRAKDKSILRVEKVKCEILYDPPLTALISIVAEQQEKVKELYVEQIYCENKETAEGIAKLMEQSQMVSTPPNPQPDGADNLFWIDIVGDMGGEGWSAIRRAVELLAAAHGKEIFLGSARKHMSSGRRDDLKAIWDNIFNLSVVDSDYDNRLVEFNDTYGEGGGWDGVEGERRGLEAVIDMTDEEWLEELRQYGLDVDEDSEDAGSEGAEGEEMGEEEEAPEPQ